MRRSLNLLLVLAFLCALAGGCFDPEDSPIEPDPAVSTYPFPDTADQLMANVRDAYDGMDSVEYAFTLHEDFEFVFSPECLIGPDDDTYSREEDLLHTTRLLDGEPGFDMAHQRVLPAVRDIAFLQFENLTGWSEVSMDEPGYPGGLKAMYAVTAVMTLDTVDDNTYGIDSLQLFFAKRGLATLPDGGTRQRYYLIGQQDLAAE
ncbi:MAG: hypothetical protein Q7W56_11500 [Candidatus Latescibacteria bacterium]|nr:hypothetical protein [Candidatus Latescibacterota bacterium]